MTDDTLSEAQLAHAPLGPSSAEGWSTCADYVNANRGLPNHDTRASAEGTAAHWISEQCLATGLDAHDFIGATLKVADWLFTWDEDDADLLQPGIAWTRSQPGLFFGEQRVDISPVTIPGQFGTADRAIIHHDVLISADLKWGRGIPVNPVANKQIMLYALGFLLRYRDQFPGIRRVMLVIDQPRHAGGGGMWETTVEDLMDFGRWIKTRAEATTAPETPRTASLAGCQWCRRKWAPGGCAEFDRYVSTIIGTDIPDMDYPIIAGQALGLPRDLTPERRSFILENRKLLETWLDALKEEELADGLAGRETPGRKPVLGNKTPAKWIEKAEAEIAVRAELGDSGFNLRLKTPTQIAKVADADTLSRLDRLIDAGEKKPVMVSAQDARPAIPLLTFDDLPEGETE